MPGYQNIKDLVDEAYEKGANHYTAWRKVPQNASAQTVWFDLSFAWGLPAQNSYCGSQLQATLVDSKHGIPHGQNVSPQKKHLHKLSVSAQSAGVAPAHLILCDFLLYYPQIDFQATEPQVFGNAVSLPRYATGHGVKAFLLSTDAPIAQGATFYIEYTNENGVAGKQSAPHTLNTQTQAGVVVHSGTATATFFSPFMQVYDQGIRSVQSITFSAPYSGVAALVLVKPIATIMIREAAAWVERDYLLDFPSLPVIEDGAVLNFLCAPNGSWANVPILGEMTTIWR